jgi:hypothetical protein
MLLSLFILLQQLAGVVKVAWRGLVGKGSFVVSFEIYLAGGTATCSVVDVECSRKKVQNPGLRFNVMLEQSFSFVRSPIGRWDGVRLFSYRLERRRLTVLS